MQHDVQKKVHIDIYLGKAVSVPALSKIETAVGVIFGVDLAGRVGRVWEGASRFRCSIVFETVNPYSTEAENQLCEEVLTALRDILGSGAAENRVTVSFILQHISWLISDKKPPRLPRASLEFHDQWKGAHPILEGN